MLATTQFWVIRAPTCGCIGTALLVSGRSGGENRSVAALTDGGALLEPGSFAALLEPEDWSALQARGHRRTVAREAVLMYDCEPGDRVMVVLAGRVKVTTVGDDGQETLLSVRGPGEILGELSFLDDSRG